jgi:hypothetical protein
LYPDPGWACLSILDRVPRRQTHAMARRRVEEPDHSRGQRARAERTGSGGLSVIEVELPSGPEVPELTRLAL